MNEPNIVQHCPRCGGEIAWDTQCGPCKHGEVSFGTCGCNGTRQWLRVAVAQWGEPIFRNFATEPITVEKDGA